MSRTARSYAPLLAGAAFAAIAFALPGTAQEANYAGESVDPVTGYLCVTPFCDTVVLPDSDCLCQKLNPNETRRADLQLACTDMKTHAQCTVSPN